MRLWTWGWVALVALTVCACGEGDDAALDGGIGTGGGLVDAGPGGGMGAGGKVAPGPIISPRVELPDAGADGSRNPGDDAGDDDSSVAFDAGNRCGDGTLDRGEACDPGKDACCDADCSGPVGSSTPCRAASGACDLAESCDGESVACPDDDVRGVGHVCRTADGACDVAEICNGVGKACPADTVAPGPGSVKCGDASGAPCDADDYCDGVVKTCPDLVQSTSLKCGNASGGPCDADDYCDGDGKDCLDSFAPSSQQCGTAGPGLCDLDDYCPGDGVDCPDTVAAGIVICRDTDANECDLPELCPGTGPDCPVDAFQTELYPCGDGSSDDCDYPDACDGFGACQPRPAEAGTPCSDPTPGDCNDARCDGVGACDAAYAPEDAGYVCRPATGECDEEETCDGAGNTCPSDVFVSLAKPCGDGTSDECTSPDSCDGFGSCDPNHADAGFPCGDESASDCDGSDACNGAGACDPRYVDAGVICGDVTNCNREECSGSGACDSLGDEPDASACDLPSLDPSAAGECSLGLCCPGETTSNGTGCGFDVREDNLVFVTSVDSLTGDLGGIGGAQQTCDSLAAAANLRGTYRPWLSDSVGKAIDRVSDGPYRRVDDVLVANDKGDLTDGSLGAAIEITELGQTSTSRVWTGSDPTGIGTGNYCGDWNLNSGDDFADLGDASATDTTWTWTDGGSTTHSCDTQAAVYCIQDDCPGLPDVDFMNDPANCGACGNLCAGTCTMGECAGLVFVTSQQVSGNFEGVSGGDQVCNYWAQQAGLLGSFAAWLSDLPPSGPASNAVDRIRDQRYLRMDGVEIADSLSDLTDGSLAAPILLTELGAVPPLPYVWTGTLANGTAVPGDRDCGEWNSSSPGDLAQIGYTISDTSSWTQYLVAGCAMTASLYCFQVGPVASD